MKYTQNEKIMQISEEILVVGVDIASEIHYARAFNNRGIEVGKLIRFTNSEEGFIAFETWAEELKVKYNKNQVIVGMEPTRALLVQLCPAS